MTRYRQLGRAGVRVSPLAVGTVNFGMVTPEHEAHAILDEAMAHGLNFVDTADNYNAGLSEEIVGNWLSEDPARREHVVLATKVYYPPIIWTSPDPADRTGEKAGINERGLSARHIIRGCEASLRRLKTDCIDLYQMHHVDRRVPVDEIWQAMETLVAQGKVIYVGTSNHAGWHIARAAETARARNFYAPVTEQSLYNLTARTVELEVIPACQHYGIGFLAFSPLGEGALAGARSDAMRGRTAARNLSDDKRAQIAQFESLCGEAGLAPSEVAIAWVLGRDGVTSTITGPRTVEQLRSALRAAELVLDADFLAALDALFPGPGGPAPEAYTW
jgi:aryl-alcohol dehydrogenase-like predicted oxidoreductase